jgi:hypothetical protein
MYCVLLAPGQDKLVVVAELNLLSGVSVDVSSSEEQVSFKELYDTLSQPVMVSHEFMQLWRSGAELSDRAFPIRRMLHWT